MNRRVESQPLLGDDTQSTIAQSRRCRNACIFLLTSQFFERISFYALVCNLVYMLNKNPYVWDADNAMIATLIFSGASFCTAVLGGWLADTILSKFRVITIGYLIALVFYICFPLLYMDNADGQNQMKISPFCIVHSNKTSRPIWDDPDLTELFIGGEDKTYTVAQENCSIWIIMALVGVGVGDAFVRSVISPFGADQLHYRDPEEVRTFFSWYYWTLNAGALIAYVAFAYVQQNVSTFWGYLLPYILLALSAVIFVCGRPFYLNRPSHNTTLGDVFSVVGHGVSRRCGANSRRERVTQESDVPVLATGTVSSKAHKQPGCLSLAKIRYGGRFPETTVNDVRTFLQVLAILVCLIIYFVSYFQMETTFKTQGLHMRIQFGSIDFSIPVAWLTLCNVLTVILMLPLINSFLYPWLDKIHFPATLRARMLIGMLFAVLAMVVAGLVEHYRLEMFWGADNQSPLHPEHGHRQKIGNTTYYASDMAIYWQIPQYMLVGLSEIFTSVAGLEFAYSHAPRSMQSLVTGIFWLVTGFGSLLGSLLLSASRNVFLFEEDYSDINCRIPCGSTRELRTRTCHACHLDYYFYALAILQMVGMFLFALVAWVALPRSQSTLQVMRKVTHSSRGNQPLDPGARQSRRQGRARSRSSRAPRRKGAVNASDSNSGTDVNRSRAPQQPALFTEDITFDSV